MNRHALVPGVRDVSAGPGGPFLALWAVGAGRAWSRCHGNLNGRWRVVAGPGGRGWACVLLEQDWSCPVPVAAAGWSW